MSRKLFSQRPFVTQNIFVSSTFLDMQVERDYLKKRVLPVIRDYALKYRINIELVDLRFGIDIGNTNSLRKVVNICRDEIVRCQPMFIAFLGDRYGTKVNGTNDSITAQEIKYANELGCNCLYFMRDIKNEELLTEKVRELYISDASEMDSFKKAIIDKSADRCIPYSAEYDDKNKELILQSDFAELVIERLKSMIDDIYHKAEREYECAMASYIDYSRFINKDYIATDIPAVKQLNASLKSNEKIIILYGASGCGKSMLLADFVCKAIDQKAMDVLTYAPVASNGNSGTIDMLNTFIQYLAMQSGETFVYEEAEEQLIEDFYRRLQKHRKNLVLVCDEFEKLNDVSTKSKWIQPESIPTNIKIILSTTDEADVKSLQFDSKVIEIGTVQKETIAGLVTGYLSSHNINVSKSFFNGICKRLTEKLANEEMTILYFLACLDYVFLNDRKDADKINAIVKQNLENEDSAATDHAVTIFYLNKIESIPTDFGDLMAVMLDKRLEMFDSSLANLILASLAFSKNGLRESDLANIAKAAKIQYVNSEFAFMRKSMQGYFVQVANGAWTFVHSQTKKCFENIYLKDKAYSKKIKTIIANVLMKLPNKDTLKYQGLIELLCDIGDYTSVSRIINLAYENLSTWLPSCTKELCLKQREALTLEKSPLVKYITSSGKINRDFTLDFISKKFLPVYRLLADYKEILALKEAISDYYKQCTFKEYLEGVFLRSLISKTDNQDEIYSLYQKVHDIYYKISDTYNMGADMFAEVTSFFIEEVKYMVKIKDREKALAVLDYTNGIIKETPIRSRSTAHWTILAEVYLLYAQINLAIGRNEVIDSYITKVEELFNRAKISKLKYFEFLEVLLILADDFYANKDNSRALRYFEKLIALSKTYRNEEKTFKAIFTHLKICTQYQMIKGLLQFGMNEDELQELLDEYNRLYEKSWDDNVKFHSLNVDELLLLIQDNDYEALRQKYLKVLADKEILTAKIGSETIEAMLLTYARYMDKIHSFIFTNKDCHTRQSEYYKKIYEFAICQKDSLASLLSQEAIRDITFYYFLSLGDKVEKSDIITGVFEMSVKIFKRVESEDSLLTAINDCYYLCDAYCLTDNDVNAIRHIKTAIELAEYGRDSLGYKMDTYICKLNSYLCLCSVSKSTEECSHRFINKIVAYLDNKADKESAMGCWNILFSALFKAKTLADSDDAIEKKQLFNYLLQVFDDHFNNIKTEFNLEYYNIPTTTSKRQQGAEDKDTGNSQKERIHALDSDNERLVGEYASIADFAIDTNTPIAEMEEMWKRADDNTSKAIDKLQKELKGLRLSEDIENDFEGPKKGEEVNAAFWQKQINKGYYIGYYRLGLLAEKKADIVEALKLYRQGAEHGNLPCMNALGYFLLQSKATFEEGYEYQLRAARAGYYPAISNIIYSFKERLNLTDGIYEELLKGCHSNLMYKEYDQVNPEVIKTAKLCIDNGNLDIEKYPWFLKYYNPVSIDYENGARIQTAIGATAANEKHVWLTKYRQAAVVYHDADAMKRLAMYYFHGHYVDFNPDKATYWCMQAAKHGDKSFCSVLGLAIYFGLYTFERRLNLAIEFFIYALQNGDNDIKTLVADIYDSEDCPRKGKNLLEKHRSLWE